MNYITKLTNHKASWRYDEIIIYQSSSVEGETLQKPVIWEALSVKMQITWQQKVCVEGGKREKERGGWDEGLTLHYLMKLHSCALSVRVRDHPLSASATDRLRRRRYVVQARLFSCHFVRGARGFQTSRLQLPHASHVLSSYLAIKLSSRIHRVVRTDLPNF